MWEDEKNKQGGRWLVNTKTSQRPDLDRIWLETVRHYDFFQHWGTKIKSFEKYVL
jgi:hypothetical protein